MPAMTRGYSSIFGDLKPFKISCVSNYKSCNRHPDFYMKAKYTLIFEFKGIACRRQPPGHGYAENTPASHHEPDSIRINRQSHAKYERTKLFTQQILVSTLSFVLSAGKTPPTKVAIPNL
jgi:hypothetical protein